MILAILIAVIAWLLTFILPWWSVGVPGLIFGTWLGRSGWTSFGWGFVGIGGLWLVQSLFIHIANNGILTNRMAGLFSLPSPLLIIALTVLVGGLIGGLTTLTSYLLGKIISQITT